MTTAGGACWTAADGHVCSCFIYLRTGRQEGDPVTRSRGLPTHQPPRATGSAVGPPALLTPEYRGGVWWHHGFGKRSGSGSVANMATPTGRDGSPWHSRTTHPSEWKHLHMCHGQERCFTPLPLIPLLLQRVGAGAVSHSGSSRSSSVH